MLSKTILLVEDEAIIALLHKKKLNKYGFDVVTADTGEKAVEIVRSDAPVDLILMDINLGDGIDGTEAAEIILKIRNIPLVFLSSHTEPEVVNKTEGITSYGYIVKNSGETVLMASIRMAFKLFDAHIKNKSYNQNLEKINKELIRSENELKESEERYKSIISVSNTGAWEYHYDADYLWCSPEYFTMLGRDPDDFMIDGSANLQEAWKDLIHPDDRGAVLKLFSDYLANGSKGMYENYFRMQHKSGEWVWIRSRGQTLKNVDGSLSDLTVGTHIDITELKIAERIIKNNNQELAELNSELHKKNMLLQEQEREYRTLFENTGSGIIVIEEDTTISLANDIFAARLGYTRDEIENVKKWTELVHEDDLDRMLEQHRLRRDDPDKADSSYEFRFKARSGEYMDTLLFISMLPGTSRSIASLIDITANKTAIESAKRYRMKLEGAYEELEAAYEELEATNEEIEASMQELASTARDLQESEAKFRSLAESVPVAIMMYQDDKWIYVNPAAEKMSGYSKEELLDMKFWDFVAPEHQSKVKETGQGRQRDLKSDPDYEFKIISKDGIEKWVHLYGSTVLHMGKHTGLISVIDITENKEIAEKLKLSEHKYRKIFENAQDVLYQTDIDGTIIEISPSIEKYSDFTREDLIGTPVQNVYQDPDDRNKLIKLMLEKGEVVDYELRLKSKDDRLIITAISSNIVYDSLGKPISIEGSLRDITERKKTEEKISLLLAEKDLLLKEVHHRIKNNMNTIKGLLTLQIHSEDNPQVVASLQSAESRVHSMLMLYDRLYSANNYRELSVKEYLAPLASEIIGSFPCSNKVAIETDIDDFILNVRMLSPLGIIVNELLTNMMKYAFAGRDSGKIFLSAEMENNRVRVVIEDNGSGLPEAVNFGSSTGFGLDLVKMLTDQIEGSIRIERGEGTRFILEFDV